MIEVTEKQNCCGCTACVAVCPKNCIEMKEDMEGFLYSFAGQFSLSHHFDHLQQNPYLREYCTTGEEKYPKPNYKDFAVNCGLFYGTLGIEK